MKNAEKNTRGLIIFFMIVLTLSGFTAIPVESELNFLSGFFALDSSIGQWLDKVSQAFQDTNKNYPFFAYGYDWLAFAHFVLAILFIGPLKDPVRNKWVIEFGMITCILIIPFAVVAGHYRAIPLWWRLIDCCFGIIGIIPLLICLRQINKIEKFQIKNYEYETND